MKKGMIAAVAAVAVLLAAGVFALCQREPTAADWAQNLQKQKAAPYQTGTFTPPGGESVALKYRVFKPAIDITAIPGEPKDWRQNPVDAFLRQCYVELFDPAPTFAKDAEGLVEGMKPIEETLERLPQFRNDPLGYYKKFRGNYTERKLLGEIVIDDIHMLVAVYVDEYGPFKCGTVFVKTADGFYYEHPALKAKNQTLDALARDQYGIVCNHFPEYGRKK